MTNNKDKKVLNVPNLRFPEFTNLKVILLSVVRMWD